MKKDLTCAIADLGLCVKLDSSSDSLDKPINNKVGTKRYLAPEILDDSIDQDSLEAWKQADVYSIGLVFWEIGEFCQYAIMDEKKFTMKCFTARRTKVTEVVEDHRLPYFELVNSDPTLEEMRLVVCEKKVRPSSPRHWESSKVFLIDPLGRPTVTAGSFHCFHTCCFYKNSKTKQISSEYNSHFWQDCGSGRVNHWWHLSCYHILLFHNFY